MREDSRYRLEVTVYPVLASFIQATEYCPIFSFSCPQAFLWPGVKAMGRNLQDCINDFMSVTSIFFLLDILAPLGLLKFLLNSYLLWCRICIFLLLLGVLRSTKELMCKFICFPLFCFVLLFCRKDFTVLPSLVSDFLSSCPRIRTGMTRMWHHAWLIWMLFRFFLKKC